MLCSKTEENVSQAIPLFTMQDNPQDLPVFIRLYGREEVTKGMHSHQMIQINYMASGSIGHQINTSEFIVTEGDAFVIPPYVPHGLVPLDDLPFTIVELEFNPEFLWGQQHAWASMESFFDFAFIEPFLISEKDVRPRLNIPVGERKKILESLYEIMEEYSAQQQGFLLAIKGGVLRLLVHLGRLYTQEVTETTDSNLVSTHSKAIGRALAFIDQNINANLTVNQVAKEAILSKSYFCYIFKQITGRTFIEYLQEKRLEKACALLVDTNELISDIALTAGFSTVTHFNRVFKQKLKISPREYRKLYKT